MRPAVMDLSLAALAVASGVTDVTTFLALGDVFTSAMTGNTALLGIALSRGEFLSASHSMLALFGFGCGAAFATAMCLRRKTDEPRGPGMIRPLLLSEAACLGVFAALLSATGRPGESVALYALILLSALGMGMQGVVARQINSPGINTIVFTTTVVTIVISLTERFFRRPAVKGIGPDTKRQIGIFLAYACGALLAGFLVGPALAVLAWIPMAAVLIAFACSEAAATTQR